MKWLFFTFAVCLVISSTHAQCISEDDSFPVGKIPTNVTGVTGFGLDLFKELFPYNISKNFFFSPYSIWSALTLAYFGSSGNTELELKKVLQHQDKVSAIVMWRTIDFMYRMRQKNNTSYAFALANRAYFDSSVDVRPCMRAIFNQEIETLNMTAMPLESSDTINNWVSDVTKNRITQLVTPGDLANANMALVNAAFFKGTWLYQFKPSQTKKNLFYMSADEYAFVDMMTQKGNFRHGVSEEIGAHVLELPYTGETISMFILLPPFISGAQGFDAMVEKLNATTLKNAMFDTWRAQIEVTIPKFKLEENVGDELIHALSAMGINDVFDNSASDLSSFAKNERLSIGKAVHKAFVEISEEGTEAAAATAFISFRVARPVGPQKFVCNHPFLFIIYDNLAENILFMGAYKNPKA